jgi:tetracycline repressor-like protein
MRWRKWSRQFEKRWAGVIEHCMEAGYLDKGDPLVATRLILGMIIWVSKWCCPVEKITADEIADTAIGLLRLRAEDVQN